MTSQQTLENALRPIADYVRARSEVYEPDDSYWYHRPTLDFPPCSVRLPAEFRGGERLSLAITQTGLAPAKQRELVREWCELLPKFETVRTLWFQSKVTQEMFEAACAMRGLEGLYVKWSAITSLAPIAGLSNLSHFHLGGAPSAENVDALASLPNLIDLEILNVRAAGDLGFLRGLPRLRALLVGGDTNSLKSLKIASLGPIAELHELERLSLRCVDVADESLALLAALQKLTYLGISNEFPIEEFARLAGVRPDIRCDRFEPIWGPVASIRCRKCKEESMHALTGKGTRWLCAHCDDVKLARHVERFQSLKQVARDSRVSATD